MSYDPRKITNPLHKDYKAPPGLDVTPFGSAGRRYIEVRPLDEQAICEAIRRSIRRSGVQGLR